MKEYFPMIWEKVEIAPVPKKEKTGKSSYSPVSLLSSTSKIYERLFVNQVNEYFENIYSKYQGGLPLHKIIWSQWLKLKKIEIREGSLNNLYKAIHCMLHDLMLAKLDAYGFDKK